MRSTKRYLSIAIVFVMIITSMMSLGFETVYGAGNTYYVSPDGSDTNNGSIGSPFKTVWYASRNLNAGDTLYVRGGTYTNDAFWSYSAGTRESPITVKAYSGEFPVFTGSGVYSQILHFGQENSYITVDGLNTLDTSDCTPVIFSNTSHITIKNCSFKNNAGSASTIMQINLSSYITVENCTFDTTGGDLLGAGEGDGIYVNAGDHCLIQNNFFTKCGHYAIDLKDFPNTTRPTSYNNIVRNNLIEQHWSGGIGLIFGAHHNLIENNRIYYVGEECTYPKTGVQIAAEKNIVRNNVFGWASDGTRGGAVDTGISLLSYYLNGMNQNCIDNRVYNNITYKNGGKPLMISEKHATVVDGNKVLNNIFYYNRLAGTHEDWWPAGNWYWLAETWHSTTYQDWYSNFPRNNSFNNNMWKHADANGEYSNVPLFYFDGGKEASKAWGDTLSGVEVKYPAHFYGNLEENPKFVNADNGDFRLGTDSAAIDAGAFLAKTTSSGAATTVVPVDDTLFFSDGYGIADGDTIQIGNNSPVRIISVDYNANTLTVSSPVTFNTGDNVSFPYNGSAPDLGISEYDINSSPMPTLNPTPTARPTPTPTPTPTPAPSDKLAVQDVSANVFQDPFIPSNTLDGSFVDGSRWSGASQWANITYDLGSLQSVGSVDIAWYNALSQRTTFDISVSTDGDIFTKVYSGTCSGTTTDFERYTLSSAANARYVRIIGHYNSTSKWSEWISITEAAINDAVGTKLTISNASANTFQDPYTPAKTLDGSMDGDSRWSGATQFAYITYDLGSTQLVSSVDIAWYNALNQKTTFDIAVSSDGNAFTTVYSGINIGASLDFEKVVLSTAQSARYVRIIGHNNSIAQWSEWISITEVEIYGGTSVTPTPTAEPTATSVVTPTPTPTPTPAGILTVTLQNGLDDYNGSKDVSTIKEYPSTDGSNWMGYFAEGAKSSMRIYDDGVKGWNSLIYFDISRIPQDATITSAKLKLYSYWGPIGYGTIDLNRVTDNYKKGMWVEGDLISEYRSSGAAFLKRAGTASNWSDAVSWTDTSDSSIMDSVNPTASGTFEITPAIKIGWDVSSDLKDDVQAWVNGTAVNQGWYLRARQGTGIHVYFASNQCENNPDAGNNPAYRPILEISYVAGAAPTPTPTPADVTGPVIHQPDKLTLLQSDALSLEIKADDEQSGVKEIGVTLDGALTTNPIIRGPASLAVGNHTITIRAADNAGNVSEKTFILKVTIDIASLDELLKAGAQQGWITNDGTLNSLSSKVESIRKDKSDGKNPDISLNAFENEIKALSGKNISSSFAQLLLDDIAYLRE
jgi:hypothetical protein